MDAKKFYDVIIELHSVFNIVYIDGKLESKLKNIVGVREVLDTGKDKFLVIFDPRYRESDIIVNIIALCGSGANFRVDYG